MMMLITREEFATFTPSTQSELLATWSRKGGGQSSVAADPAMYDGIDMESVVDLSPEQVKEWMKAASDKTKLGMRVIAEQGPVIEVTALIAVGITNFSHFQSRTTTRTRTITKDNAAYLLGWDEDWSVDERGVQRGRYAVTNETHTSLRRYFGL